MERLRCRAVVLGSVDFGESDRIVTFFSDLRGRLAAFARGARKSRRRFAGVLEPFTLLQVDLVETRGDTFRLDAAEVLDGFGELRLEMGRIARAAYAAELVRELCRDREPHPELFALLCRFLGALAREGAGALALMRFELLALAEAGLMPHLEGCARCGAEAVDGARFDPEHGGLLCARCAGDALGPRISRETAAALARLQGPVAPRDLELPGHVRAEARSLLSHFVVHHLGHRQRSLEFMREVGLEG